MNNNITSKQFIKEAQNHKKRKVCSNLKCKQHNPQLLSEFNKGIKYKDGLQYRCRSCEKEYNDNECRFKRWFRTKSNRRGDIEFTILPTDIPGVKIRETITIDRRGRKYKSWEGAQYPEVCSKWGVKLNWSMNGVSQYNSPSLDRKDPRFGYIPGNVRIVCQSYNMAKYNCPPDEWDVIEKQIARSILGMTKPF